MWFLFLLFVPSFGRATSFAPGSILDLYVFLSSREDVPHPGDFLLHQVFVERVGDLQSSDECCSSHVVIVVIHKGHLALEITDIVLEALSGLHFDCEEMIVVPLKFPPGGELVKECICDVMKAPKRVYWERIEIVIGDPFEIGRECLAEEEVVVIVNRHLVLELAVIQEGFGGSQVEVQGRHYELLWEAERGYFLRKW